MSKIRLLPMLFLVILFQLLPVHHASADGPKKKLQIKSDKNYFLVKPGETKIVDINVNKMDLSKEVELKVKTSPLQISTKEDTFSTNSNTFHATMQVTTPTINEKKSYSLVLSASNGENKSKKYNITFNTNEEAPGPDFNISSAALSAPEGATQVELYLGGIGFGQTPRVIINGVEVSSKIVSVTDSLLTLKASSKAELNFNDDKNEILIDVNSRVSNRFILDLDLSN